MRWFSVTLSKNPQNITVTQLEDGRFTLESGGSNVNMNNTDPYTFWCYNDSNNDNSKHILCPVVRSLELSGEYAIVNMGSGAKSGVAMLAQGVDGVETANRVAQTVPVTQSVDGPYIRSNTLAKWTFARQGDGIISPQLWMARQNI